MRHCVWLLLISFVSAMLAACGGSGDSASTSPQTEAGDARDSGPDTSRGDNGGGEESASADPIWDPAEPELVENPWGDGPAYAVGSGKLAATAAMIDGRDAARYTVRLVGELGLPIENWSGTLRNHESKVEMHISAGGRPQQGIGDGLFSVARHDGTLRVFGSFYDAREDEEVQFDFEFEVAGYVAPPLVEQPPVAEAADPFGDLIDDGVARTPFDTAQVVAVVGRPTEPERRCFIISSDEGDTHGVLIAAVLPTDSDLRFENRFIAVSGWMSEMVVYCEAGGELSTVLFRQGQPGGSVRSGTVAVASDGQAESYEYVTDGDAGESHPQPQYDYNLKTLGLLPSAMEAVATRYHIVSGHAGFLVCTSDLSVGASVEERMLYRRADPVELEVGGQAVEALAYRIHHVRVSNSDRVRSDSFGVVSEGVAYFYPDGRLIRIDGDGYTTRACGVEEAAEAIGTTAEALLSPVDLDGTD